MVRRLKEKPTNITIIDTTNNSRVTWKANFIQKKKTDCLLRLIAAIYRMAELQSYLQNI